LPSQKKSKEFPYGFKWATDQYGDEYKVAKEKPPAKKKKSWQSTYKDLAEYYKPGKKKNPPDKIWLGVNTTAKKKKKKKKAGAEKMAVKKFVRLECKSGSSNKFYEVELIQDGSKFTTAASYGRIGNNPQHQVKYEGSWVNQASQMFSDLVKEKLKKGYVKVKESTEETVQKTYVKTLSTSGGYTVELSKPDVQKKVSKVEKEDVEEDRFDNLDID
jgi:predicted DNA-binding WGR domain protein